MYSQGVQLLYVRPIDPDRVLPDADGWLIRPEEGLGCSIRAQRGGGGFSSRSSISGHERFSLVLSGSVDVKSDDQVTVARVGDVVFAHAGASVAHGAGPETTWLEVIAAESPDSPRIGVEVYSVDHNGFPDRGFASQKIVSQESGATSLRVNAFRVKPGSGGPDFHIHSFDQIYIVQSGAMTVDVGRHRTVAHGPCVVVLPAGVVHRNFNASDEVEYHIAVLVPEPPADVIFDYAITIHDGKAQRVEGTPPPLAVHVRVPT